MKSISAIMLCCKSSLGGCSGPVAADEAETVSVVSSEVTITGWGTESSVGPPDTPIPPPPPPVPMSPWVVVVVVAAVVVVMVVVMVVWTVVVRVSANSPASLVVSGGFSKPGGAATMGGTGSLGGSSERGNTQGLHTHTHTHTHDLIHSEPRQAQKITRQTS